MIIEIEKSVIQEQLAHAAKGVSNKNTIPILSGIKFVVEASGLTMTGSDGKTVVQTFISADEFKLIQNGSVVLEKGNLEKIIQKMPNEIIRIQTENNLNTIFSAKKAELQLQGMDAEEYPNFLSNADDERMVINCEVLKNLIKQTQFSASDQETTPILMGIKISIFDNEIEFLACDRHRMARVRQSIVSPFEKTMVVDRDGLVNLSKVIGGKEDVTITTKVSGGEVNQVIFSTKNTVFVAGTLSGAYPDTTKLVPDSFKMEFTIKRLELINSLELAKITTEDGKTNTVKFNFTSNELVVSSKNGVGNMKETLNIENPSGQEIAFSANAEYILQALKAIDFEYVTFKVNGPMSAIIISTEADKNVIHLVLPCRAIN